MAPTDSNAQQEQVRQAHTNVTKAAQKELAGDYDNAFALYLTAAQTLLHAAQTAPDAPTRAVWREAAKKALDRAQKIKALKSDVRPVQRDRLAKEQQIAVLNRSSTINGRLFPIWTDDTPLPLPNSEGKYDDPDGQMPLSHAQTSSLSAWKRPEEAYKVYSISSESLLPCDLLQYVITDCSVVAALTVCVDHNLRFKTKLGVSTVFPQNQELLPQTSSSGAYAVSLFVNGTPRCIVIDDKLPVREDGHYICVSTSEKAILWPSLVEKAYLKIMGGYDFEGSNGAIDLYAITGWIPEHVLIMDARFQREKAWKRLRKHYNQGDCMMTVGTGKDPGMYRDHHLTPYHAYAVIDLEDDDAGRMLSLWNPWGRHSNSHKEAKSDSSREGLLRISWDDLCGLFDSIYVNWNPEIFPHRIAIHSTWSVSQQQNADGAWTSNHQYNVNFSNKVLVESEVWVLLSRHSSGRDDAQSYIASHLFHAVEADPLAFQKPALDTTYTDSPHVLVRSARFPDENVLSLIISRHGPGMADVAYTLQVFSASPFTLSEPPHLYAFSQWMEGSFSAATAGGNALYPSFMRNPQYGLTILPSGRAGSSNGAHLRLAVHGSKDLPLHVQIVWAQGQRVSDVRQAKVVKDSGMYSYGFALCETQLQEGTYTIIISSFDPGQLGAYRFLVECSQRFEVKTIPQEGAGMFSKKMQGKWEPLTSERPARSPTYEVSLDAATQLTIRCQLVPPTPATPIQVSLHSSSSDRSSGPMIASSGDFNDSVSGVVISNARVQPGRYLLMPAVMSPRVEARFQMTLYSSACAIRCRQL